MASFTNQKQRIIDAFDPNNVGLTNGNIFGFPFTYSTADILLIPVPWEVTVSFHTGTANGPDAILAASPQLDFYDYDYPDGWKQGIYMLPAPDWITQQNQVLRAPAYEIVTALEETGTLTGDLQQSLSQINESCDRLNQWVKTTTQQAIADGKKVGILGGDHSVPYGALQAIAQHHPNFGILHIDAHCDLRQAYQGFTYSHASIMRNALALPQLTRLIQVGIRDVSAQEIDFAQRTNGRVLIHHDSALKRARYRGTSWHDLCTQIIADLPEKVYISFDIDGLDPKLCPKTGTPVPGGLDLEEAFYLLRLIADSREIIGFDLCEVGSDDWDGNVGARIVYKLCNLMGLSTQPQL